MHGSYSSIAPSLGHLSLLSWIGLCDMAHWAKRWPATRRRILARDNYVCMIDHCKRRADSIDHIWPRSEGGSHEDWNLRAAYHVCNSRRGKGRAVLPRARVSRWT